MNGTVVQTKVASQLPLYTGYTFNHDKIAKIREKLPKPGGYKWFEDYIATLDPYQDWEQIVRCDTHFSFSPFFSSLAHSAMFIDVLQHPLGSSMVKFTGKIYTSHFGHSRNMDANGFTFSMMLEGLSSTEGSASVERLNHLHKSLWNRYREPFVDYDDHLIAVVKICLFPHRIREVFNLPPLPENRRIALLQWGRTLWSKVYGPEGPHPMDAFPKTWDEVVEYSQRYDAKPFLRTQDGKDAGEALIQHFCWACFPRPLWFVGREIVLMTISDAAVEYMQLGPRHPWLSFLIKKAVHFGFFIGAMSPDPRTGLVDVIEQQEAKKQSGGFKANPSHSRVDFLYTIVPLLVFWFALKVVGFGIN
ncbi:hypothetical protein H9Q72_008796 [Fusarium xylarioides]|uniref:ER-bound oxygenase mpaB/mpaB'/Rubber oxygenase catalytic domain-containing protein n=1 Tax=Fusarium xylarioides TaxID=221167 RepID=A0A9P7L3S9_9HYPO|nr:hypothetical protein H9Q72_008796 [Fusarium xylarioides]